MAPCKGRARVSFIGVSWLMCCGLCESRVVSLGWLGKACCVREGLGAVCRASGLGVGMVVIGEGRAFGSEQTRVLQGMVAHLGKGLGWLARLLGNARKAMQPACLLGHEAGGGSWFVCRGI